jgi:transposase-like protein
MRQPNSKPPRRVFTREQRSEWVSRFRSGGLTQAQFAQQYGLNRKTLERWLYGDGRGSNLAPQQRAEAVRAKGAALHRSGRTAAGFDRKRRRAPTTLFQEVKWPPSWSGPPRAVWAAEVTWPSGVTVRLGVGAKGPWIKALLGAVHQAC